jgi:hypothetical protein
MRQWPRHRGSRARAADEILQEDTGKCPARDPSFVAAEAALRRRPTPAHFMGFVENDDAASKSGPASSRGAVAQPRALWSPRLDRSVGIGQEEDALFAQGDRFAERPLVRQMLDVERQGPPSADQSRRASSTSVSFFEIQMLRRRLPLAASWSRMHGCHLAPLAGAPVPSPRKKPVR